MAPTFRSSRSGRQFTENASRSRAADHDVFEGLPIRRWTRQNHTVSQDAQINIPSNTGREPQADYPFPELPMPKDSHLLPPQSRALLRAARAGYIYLRAPSKDSQATEEKEPAETDETAPATKMERSYTARKWSQLPKHVEVPEVEFLAKRRAGLPSLYGAAGVLTASAANAAQAMRKTKVKKIDPISGNVTIYDVWIPEGQKVEGEIKDESQVAPAQQDATVTRVVPPPGTVVDGVGVANAEGVVVAPPAAADSPSKRPGPPPPKRKNKSISGNGQKRVMFAPGEGAEVEGDSMVIDGEQDKEMEGGEEGEDGVKSEEKTPNEPALQPNESEPTPMALDQSVTPNLPPPTDANTSSLTHEPTPPLADVISPEKPALSPEKPSLEETPAPQLPSEVPTEVPNVEPATNIEQQPQSPVRPQSEQLTPPNQPSTAVPSAMDIDKEPAATFDPTPNVETEVKAEVSTTPVPGDEPAATTVAPEHSPPRGPSDPVIEQVDTVEPTQPTKEPSPVQAETENAQPEQPPVATTAEEVPSQPITSEPIPQPPVATATAEEVPPSQPLASEPTPQPPAASLPENTDVPSNAESSLDKEPKQSDSNVSPPPAPEPEAPEEANPVVVAAPEPESVAAPPPSEPPAADTAADADAATAKPSDELPPAEKMTGPSDV